MSQLHALPHEHEGALGLVDECGGLFHSALGRSRHGHVTANEVDGAGHVFSHFELGIFRKVEHHGTGAAAARNVEGAVHGPGHVLGRAYLVGPLTDGLCDVYHIALLKGIGAEHLCAHLAADDNDGGAVHHGVGYARDGVGGTGAAGNDAGTRAAADAGITLGSMGGGLLVAHQYVVEAVAVVVEGIINGHDGTAGVSENRVYALIEQGTHQYFCSCDLLHTSCDSGM